MNETDRRVGQRYPVSTICQFEVPGRKYEGRLTNISLDGAFMETTAESPADGEMGTLFFSSRENQLLHLEAKVVRHASPVGRTGEAEGFGIYFIDVGEDDAKLLQTFLTELVKAAGF